MYTPLEWNVREGDSILKIEGSNGQPIAQVGSVPYWQRFTPEDKANARLIAAAPELLEALEAALGKLGTPEGYLPCVGEPITRQMQAAVLKAKGES